MAADLTKEFLRKKRLDDLDSVSVGFVGKYCHGQFAFLEFLKEGYKAGVRIGSVFPILGIVLLKSSQKFILLVGMIGAKGSRDEIEQSVTNEGFHDILRMVRQLNVVQSMVESGSDSRKGIDKSTIKIKNKSANHGVAIIGVNGFSEPCFDRYEKFWE